MIVVAYNFYNVIVILGLFRVISGYSLTQWNIATFCLQCANSSFITITCINFKAYAILTCTKIYSKHLWIASECMKLTELQAEKLKVTSNVSRFVVTMPQREHVTITCSVYHAGCCCCCWWRWWWWCDDDASVITVVLQVCSLSISVETAMSTEAYDDAHNALSLETVLTSSWMLHVTLTRISLASCLPTLHACNRSTMWRVHPAYNVGPLCAAISTTNPLTTWPVCVVQTSCHVQRF